MAVCAQRRYCLPPRKTFQKHGARDRTLVQRPALADKPLIYGNKAGNNEHQQFLKVVMTATQMNSCFCRPPSLSYPFFAAQAPSRHLGTASPLRPAPDPPAPARCLRTYLWPLMLVVHLATVLTFWHGFSLGNAIRPPLLR